MQATAINFDQPNELYETIPCFNNSNLKDMETNCGTRQAWRPQNGKNRVKIIIDVRKSLFKKVTCSFLARPYKKTFGVWYHCSRTMKSDVKLNYKYWALISTNGSANTYGWVYESLNFYRNYTYVSSHSKSENPFTGTSYPNPSFTSYDVWVDTYDISPGSYECGL